VAAQQAELAQLAAMPDAARRLEAFAEHVQQTTEVPLRKLEKGLRLFKLEPTRSLMLAGSLTPPAAIGSALAVTGALNPVTAAVTGATAALGGAWWQISGARAAARAASPVGYLLDVRERLTPATLATRARKLLTGTYG
jgi:hypothetical protein